jgi:hypothetical protein
VHQQQQKTSVIHQTPGSMVVVDLYGPLELQMGQMDYLVDSKVEMHSDPARMHLFKLVVVVVAPERQDQMRLLLMVALVALVFQIRIQGPQFFMAVAVAVENE